MRIVLLDMIHVDHATDVMQGEPNCARGAVNRLCCSSFKLSRARSRGAQHHHSGRAHHHLHFSNKNQKNCSHCTPFSWNEKNPEGVPVARMNAIETVVKKKGHNFLIPTLSPLWLKDSAARMPGVFGHLIPTWNSNDTLAWCSFPCLHCSLAWILVIRSMSWDNLTIWWKLFLVAQRLDDPLRRHSGERALQYNQVLLSTRRPKFEHI